MSHSHLLLLDELLSQKENPRSCVGNISQLCLQGKIVSQTGRSWDLYSMGYLDSIVGDFICTFKFEAQQCILSGSHYDLQYHRQECVLAVSL